MRRLLVLPLLALSAAACARGTTIGPTPSSTSADITAADLERRLYLIAHDSMRGRDPGDIGNFKATEYIASEFRRLGLRPAGENGTYFQTVPFMRAAPASGDALEVGGAALTLGRDFVPVMPSAARRPIAGAQAIYAGAISDTTGWPARDAVQGKIVVFDAARAPNGQRVLGPFRGLGSSGRFAGAAALALVQLDLVPSELVARFVGGQRMLDSTRNPAMLPQIWITPAAASRLLGTDLASAGHGVIGPAVRGSLDIQFTAVPFAARNVVAVLEGSEPSLRGQYVSLTAHNDHVGFNHAPVDHDSIRAFNTVVRPMGADSRITAGTPEQMVRVRQILDSLRRLRAPRPDSIYNGADDDGSGTVSILEIAEALASRPQRPRRSILFVSHTGEESGLVGSAWFTDHATVPIDSIVAEIDQDMIGRGTASDLPEAGPTYLEVVGLRRLSRAFGDAVEAANATQPAPFVFNYQYDTPGHPLQYYCRADHYNYARYGIPSVAISRGEHMDYHQVTDEPQYISYPDLMRVSRMVMDAAVAIANADKRPALDGPRPTDPHAPCRQ